MTLAICKMRHYQVTGLPLDPFSAVRIWTRAHHFEVNPWPNPGLRHWLQAMRTYLVLASLASNRSIRTWAREDDGFEAQNCHAAPETNSSKQDKRVWSFLFLELPSICEQSGELRDDTTKGHPTMAVYEMRT